MAAKFLSDASADADDGERALRVRQIVSECFRRWAAGEAVSEADVIAAHPDLMPELGERMRQAHFIQRAADEPPRESFVATAEGVPAHETLTDATQNLLIRCPHCRQSIELSNEMPLSDVTCTACGSIFSLVSPDTATHGASALKGVAHFELVSRLGLGSFGTVWKARDTQLDRTVAVKIPRRGQLDAEEEEKFLREARAAAQLTHPNIVSIHEIGREGDTLYIVSDFVRGVTLADWLMARRLAHQDIARLCIKLSHALDHAHERGVVHRDLKPANIMIDADGEPHITDFGLAKRSRGEITMTVEGQILGTPAYMSPEQAQGEGRTADRRSDVYSLGVILFELLTGELPFRGNTRMLVFQVIHDDPPRPRTLDSHVPRDLETICLKCLEKEPRNRYQTARDLADELQRFVDGRPIHARRISRTARAWRWCRRKPAAAALLAVVAVVAAVAPVVAINQWVLSNRAQQEADRAEARRVEVAAQRNRLRQLLYVAHINMAQQAMNEANVDRAVELLSQYKASNLRSFEWFYLWREAHRHKMLLHAHAEGVVAAALTPDRKTLASADAAGTIILGDPATGRTKSEFSVSGRQITSIAIMPDGLSVVTGDAGGEVCMWDAPSGKLRVTLGRHQARVNAVAIDAVGKRVASGATDKKAIVWDVESGGPLQQQLDHVGIVTCVEFLGDGKRLATGSRDSLVRIWNLDSGDEPLLLDHDAAVTSVALGRDDGVLVSGTDNGRVTLWDVQTGQMKRQWERHAGGVTSLDISDSQLVLSAGRDSVVQLWDAAEEGPAATVKGHTGGVHAAMFLPDGQSVATAGNEGTVKIWDTEELLASDVHRPHQQFLDELRMVPDSSTPISIGHDSATQWDARLWSPTSAPTARTLVTGPAPLLAMAISPDGKRLAVGRTLASSDLVVCDVATGQIVREIKAGQAAVMGLAFIGNERLAAASVDGNARVWTIDADEEAENLPSDRGLSMWCLAASEDGRHLAAGTTSGSIVMWDMESSNREMLRAEATGKVEGLAFAPDSNLLAVAGPGNVASVWQVETRKQVATLSGHGQTVTTVAFSNDALTVATGSSDGAVILWDAATWEPKLYLTADGLRVQSLAFTFDDRSLLAGRVDGRVHVWRGGVPVPSQNSSDRKTEVLR